MNRLLQIISTLLAAAAAATVLAQETFDFGRHDTDNDGFLTSAEWSDARISEDFDALDANGDGMLSEDEITRSLDVQIVSRPDAGADLAPREVTAQDHANVQRGQIDRDAHEEEAESDVTENTSATRRQDDAVIEETGLDTSDDPVAGQPAVEATAETVSGREQMQQASASETPAETPERDMQQPPTGVSDAMRGQGQEAGPGMRDVGNAANDEGLQAFRQADADGNGRVSESEAQQSGHDYVAIYFDGLDENGDGQLQQSEWEQEQGQAAPGVRDVEGGQESLIEEPDVPVGTETRDPVPAGTLPTEDEEGAVDFEEEFDTYDINQDGYIDREEGESELLDTEVFEETDINDDGRIDSEEAGRGLQLGGEEEENETDNGADL